jgi:hypothetical protein
MRVNHGHIIIYGNIGLDIMFACRLSKGIREAPTKAVMNELAQKSGDAPDAAYGEQPATLGCVLCMHNVDAVMHPPPGVRRVCVCV